MATTKHPRQSGATTVKKNGKIVGNIGAGKTPPQTVRNVEERQLLTSVSDNKTSQINIAQQKFSTLSQRKISYEQAQTLWNLTAKQNLVERLNIFSNYIDRLNVDDRNKMITKIGDEYHTYNPYEYEPGSRVDPLNLVLRGESLNGNVNPNVLDAFARCTLYGQNSWRNSVAQNANTTFETLDFLSADDDKWLLVKIAKNPHTRTHTITKIFDKIKDSGQYVSGTDILFYIAQNQNTSQQILEKLVEHHDHSIRIAAITALKGLRKGRT